MAGRYGVTPREMVEILMVQHFKGLKVSDLKLTKSKKGDDIDRFSVDGFNKPDGTTVPAHIQLEKVVISGVMPSRKNPNSLSMTISKITRESLSTGDYEKKSFEAQMKMIARRHLEIAKLPITPESVNEKCAELMLDEATAKKQYAEYETKYYALIDEYVNKTNEFVDSWQAYDAAMKDGVANYPSLNKKGTYKTFVERYRTHVKGPDGMVPLKAPAVYIDIPYVQVSDKTSQQRARFANRVGYASNDGKYYPLIFDFDLTFQKKSKVEAKIYANETEPEPSIELTRMNLAQWLTPKSIIMTGSVKFGGCSGSQFGISTHLEISSCTIKRSKKIATDSFNSDEYAEDADVFETSGFDDEPQQRVIAKADALIAPPANPVRDIKDNSIEQEMQAHRLRAEQLAKAQAPAFNNQMMYGQMMNPMMGQMMMPQQPQQMMPQQMMMPPQPQMMAPQQPQQPQQMMMPQQPQMMMPQMPPQISGVPDLANVLSQIHT
jgi:hypothetical protein